MGTRLSTLTFSLRYFFLCSLVLLSSCEEAGDCFHGSGDPAIEERPVGPVYRVDMMDNIDLIVHFDSIPRLRVLAGENLLPEIETSVSGETLYLRNQNNCNWIRNLNPQITVELWTPYLTEIKLDKARADIQFADTLRTASFRLDSYESTGRYDLKLDCLTATLAQHSGVSDVYAEGKIVTGYYFNVGYGFIYARNLSCNEALVTNQSVNHIYLQADQVLNATIEERGNIYYEGNPDPIVAVIKGTGQLIPL